MSGSDKKEGSWKKRFTRSSVKEQPDKYGAQKKPDTSIQRSNSSSKGSSGHSSKKPTPSYDQEFPVHLKVVNPISVSSTATGTTKVCIIALSVIYCHVLTFDCRTTYRTE